MLLIVEPIPEGTIDSELFGHEKGATGAHDSRKGYFKLMKEQFFLMKC